MNKHRHRALAFALPLLAAACGAPGQPAPQTQAKDPPPQTVPQDNGGSTVPVPDGTVIGGVIVSGNVTACGVSGSDKASERALLVDPGDPGRIWLGVENLGLFRSTDGGTSWTWAVQGLKAHTIGSTRGLCFDRFTSMAMDPFDFHHVCVGLAGRSGTSADALAGAAGVYCSRDDGQTWKQLVGSGMNTAVTAVGIDGSGQLWAGTSGTPDDQGAYHNDRGVLYTSIDDGATWVELDFGMGFVPGMVVRDFQIAPTSPQLMYVAAPIDAGALPAGTVPADVGVLLSADLGASWGRLIGGMGEAPGARSIGRIAIAPTGTRMLAGTTSAPTAASPHFYYTDDTGAGFHPPVLPVNLALDVFAFDPSDSSGRHALGFSSSGRDLWESFDGGMSWHGYGAQLPDETGGNPVVLSHIQWAQGGKTLYVAGSGASVYRSDDVGRTWTAVLSMARIPSGGPQ